LIVRLRPGPVLFPAQRPVTAASSSFHWSGPLPWNTGRPH